MLDFDGTLSPIVADYRRAKMDAWTRRALARASRRFPTAVITGRALAFVEGRVPIRGISFAGNHGLEWSIKGRKEDARVSKQARQAVNSMRTRMTKLTEQYRGTILEDKGRSLSLHYRHAPRSTHAAIRRAVYKAARETRRIRVMDGVFVHNIMPAVKRDKGTAARMMYTYLAKKKKSIPIFIGDDVTDEDAFKALRKGITVHVGKSQNSAAHYFVRSQKDVATFLEWLA